MIRLTGHIACLLALASIAGCAPKPAPAAEAEQGDRLRQSLAPPDSGDILRKLTSAENGLASAVVSLGIALFLMTGFMSADRPFSWLILVAAGLIQGHSDRREPCARHPEHPRSDARGAGRGAVRSTPRPSRTAYRA